MWVFHGWVRTVFRKFGLGLGLGKKENGSEMVKGGLVAAAATQVQSTSLSLTVFSSQLVELVVGLGWG
jgi:hypothetical protein